MTLVGETVAGHATSVAIRREAAALFATHGYEATSLRDIAASVGIKVASLYNHMRSKDDLLLMVMGGTMDDLTVEVDRCIQGHEDPVGRLIAFMVCHIRFHAERAQEVFIGNSELRALPPEARSRIAAKRRAYQEFIERLVLEAAATADQPLLDARLHSYSIVAIGTHVASWYRASGPLPLDTIVATYVKLALRGLAIPDADARVDEFC